MLEVLLYSLSTTHTGCWRCCCTVSVLLTLDAGDAAVQSQYYSHWMLEVLLRPPVEVALTDSPEEEAILMPGR